MEEKRDILLLEVNRRIGEATKLRADLDRILREAYTALDEAAAVVGSKEIASAAKFPSTTFDLSASKKKVMGVSVLSLNLENLRRTTTYGFERPTVMIDEAAERFKQALQLIVRVAELENTLVNLVEEVKKTQRRINALEQFLIPRYSATVAMISNILEERDREEFVRVKKVKQILERRAEVHENV